MVRLVTLGLVAALFFSSTFVLNRAMSLEGVHWVWTASLRYGWMLLILCLWILVKSGPKALAAVFRVFREHWVFWLVAGTIGFGFFYAPICFSAAYAPGWVIASTWQATILATPLVLLGFGRRVPVRGILLTLLIFAGILLVNLAQAGTVSTRQVLLGVLPVLAAAFAYPTGNQMVGEAKAGTHRSIPHITDPIMENAPARVLLITLGSVPFWLLLIVAVRPPAPSGGQVLNTFLVALSAGVIATSVFFHARHSATRAYQIAAVDATQAGETVFSLIGEVLLLSGALPDAMGSAGLGLTVLGIVLYMVGQSRR